VSVSEVPTRQNILSYVVNYLFQLPRVRRSTLVSRAVSVAGPTVWNSLSDDLRDPADDSERDEERLENISIYWTLRSDVHTIMLYKLTFTYLLTLVTS